jgi:hypothetical protein
VRAGLFEAVTVGAAGALALVLVLASACESSAGSVGPGGECSLATDCTPGLICIEQENGARICSDDLTRVAGDPPSNGGGNDASADADDASISDATPPRDSGADTSRPDTGGPLVDSGTD